MKLLAIDTSSDACSVAINLHHEIIETFELTPRKHIEALQPMVEAVLKESGLNLQDLDGLAFGCGPGSFSGLRIACSFIQGLSAALNLPVAAISTLGSMAFNALESNPDAVILPCLDARMSEVYTALYYFNEQNNLYSRINDCVITPESVTLSKEVLEKIIDKPIIGVGNGWDLAYVQEIWKTRFNPTLIMPESVARAGDIALLAVKDFEAGHVLTFDQIQPVYLRNNIALNLEGQYALRQANIAKKEAESKNKLK